MSTTVEKISSNKVKISFDIDAAKCKRAGLSPSTILSTLQGYYGGLYASNFNRFGKVYRVMIQSAQSERSNYESLYKIKVRNGSEMAPITEFITLKKTYGPDNINRFNMYTSMSVNGNPASGKSPTSSLDKFIFNLSFLFFLDTAYKYCPL